MAKQLYSPRVRQVARAPVWTNRVVLTFALLTATALTATFLLYGRHLPTLVDQALRARDWIVGFGPLAPVAYVLLNIAQVVIAPFPGNFMGVISGYLFGVFWGTLYSVVGLAIGASIAIGLGRIFGRPLLIRFFDESQLRAWEGKLKMRSPALWALIFMFPVPDLLIYMAGLSSMPIRWLLPAIVAGRSVGILVANCMGGWSAKLPVEWLLVKWTLLAAGALLLYRYQRTIRLYALLGYRRMRRIASRALPAGAVDWSSRARVTVRLYRDVRQPLRNFPTGPVAGPSRQKPAHHACH